MLPLTLVVPVKTADGEDIDELAAHLRELATQVDDVVVVDGSSPATRERHAAALGPSVRVLEPRAQTPMGKVGGVITGVEAARHEHVVLADDDVRYRVDQLAELASRLEHATVIRPQNHFEPLPWHARVDTARTLIARVSGGDWPGTLALRRSALLAAGGYAGDVMFENLELVRTLVAAGGRAELALDVIVRRMPSTTEHFRSQQVRQAYDELARPFRMLTFLAVVPGVVALRRHRLALALGVVVPTVAAELGRRRAGGRAVFPASSVLFASPWVAWRSLCSWVALGALLRGGVRYRDCRLRRAATPLRRLRRTQAGCASPTAWPPRRAGGSLSSSGLPEPAAARRSRT